MYTLHVWHRVKFVGSVVDHERQWELLDGQIHHQYDEFGARIEQKEGLCMYVCVYLPDTKNHFHTVSHYGRSGIMDKVE